MMSIKIKENGQTNKIILFVNMLMNMAKSGPKLLQNYKISEQNIWSKIDLIVYSQKIGKIKSIKITRLFRRLSKHYRKSYTFLIQQLK